jgi:hypothetical protein
MNNFLTVKAEQLLQFLLKVAFSQGEILSVITILCELEAYILN